jgi:hypothetical protein
VALNETLPPFMARNYTLAPFKPQNDKAGILGQGIYTAPTTMYTLDLSCEEAVTNRGSRYARASNGFSFDLGLDGNKTLGEGYEDSDATAVKQYSGMYVGWHNGGFADYYLSSDRWRSENTTFYAGFAKSKVHLPMSFMLGSKGHAYRIYR